MSTNTISMGILWHFASKKRAIADRGAPKIATNCKVAAMFLKLEIRLTLLARTHNLVPQQFLRSSDWLMHSELGYFARSLISGSNDGAATLMASHSAML